MDYVKHMSDVARARFNQLHDGVIELIWTDFPDHSNVGDSAIAIGEDHYWRSAGIAVRETHSLTTLPHRVTTGHVPVFLHGGGNLGGLYPPMCEHRYSLAEQLSPQTLLIQGPQSVHFASDENRHEFNNRMATRPQLRIAVRDISSFESIESMSPNVIMAPDAVHHLGAITAAEPVQRSISVLRRDRESAGPNRAADSQSIDWPADSTYRTAAKWLRWRASKTEATRRLAQRTTTAWIDDARARFNAGVSTLATGETIVTDRLHAMLIGLQMGRSVIAIENSNNKLGNYAETWFGDAQPDVRFAKSIGDAHRMLSPRC